MDPQKIFDIRFNYQKIYDKDSRIDTVAGIGITVVTINHNLGYIPSVRGWFNPGNSRRFPIGDALFGDFDSGVDETDGIYAEYSYLTTTSWVIGYGNLSGVDKNVTTFYRIYYDA